MTGLLDHPLAVVAVVAAAAVVVGWVALDAERLVAMVRSRRRCDRRGGWIGGAK